MTTVTLAAEAGGRTGHFGGAEAPVPWRLVAGAGV
jgi:hypothetical protein